MRPLHARKNLVLLLVHFYSDFLVRLDLPDKTGEKALNLFSDHYRERVLLNKPEESLELYNERHADGDYNLPEEQGGSKNHRFD